MCSKDIDEIERWKAKYDKKQEVATAWKERAEQAEAERNDIETDRDRYAREANEWQQRALATEAEVEQLRAGAKAHVMYSDALLDRVEAAEAMLKQSQEEEGKAQAEARAAEVRLAMTRSAREILADHQYVIDLAAERRKRIEREYIEILHELGAHPDTIAIAENAIRAAAKASE